MGKIVRMPCARVAPAEMGMAPAAKPTSFFSEGLGGFMKWTYSTDLKGYRKVMIGGVQLDCEGCPKKVRYAIELTDGVKLVRTDMENEIVYVMGKNMKMEQLKKNIRMESKSAEILDILPWKIKYQTSAKRVQPNIVHDDSRSSPRNIDDNGSQLRLSLSTYHDRTVFNTVCFFQSQKPRVRMLQPSQTPRKNAKIKKLSSHSSTSGPSGGRQQWDHRCGLSN